MKKIILILPLVLLTTISLFFLLFILLKKDPNIPPSVLIDKDLPFFSSTNIYNNKENLFSNNLKGKYTLINFFASWCTPCRAEHHLFFEIKKQKPELYIIGFSHKDDPDNSKKYLEEDN